MGGDASGRTKKHWFESWFDSEYYHKLYAHRDEAEAEMFIARLLGFLNLPKGVRVIDMACGKGRHAQCMAELGLDVLGIDLSSNNIAEAKKIEGVNLQFEVQDMRQLKSKSPCAAVLNLFTSFGYFDNTTDNLKTLKQVNKALEECGVLVIDYLNAEKLTADLISFEEKYSENILFKINRRIEGGVIYKHISFEDDGKSHLYEERVQAITLSDFGSLLNQAGFAIIHTFGDYRLNPFQKDSERLIIIAKKTDGHP